MRNATALLLLLLAACGPSVGGSGATALVGPLSLEPPPVYSLLGYRADLDLTSEQITALDSIGRAAAVRNRVVADSLRELPDVSGGRYRGAIPVNEQTQPLLDRIREQNREAVRAVEEILTPEQETEVCRLFDPARRDRDRDRATPVPRRRGGINVDTTTYRSSARWSWCAPTMPADTAS